MTAFADTMSEPPTSRAPLGETKTEPSAGRLDAQEIRMLPAQSVEHLHLDLTASRPKSL